MSAPGRHIFPVHFDFEWPWIDVHYWCNVVQEFYDLTMVDEDGERAGWTTALQTAVTSIVLLWSMRAGRNITAIPFAVSMDTDSEGWFSAPTLYQVSVQIARLSALSKLHCFYWLWTCWTTSRTTRYILRHTASWFPVLSKNVYKFCGVVVAAYNLFWITFLLAFHL